MNKQSIGIGGYPLANSLQNSQVMMLLDDNKEQSDSLLQPRSYSEGDEADFDGVGTPAIGYGH